MSTQFAVFFVVASFRLERSHPKGQQTADSALERALRSRRLGLEAKDQEECARRIHLFLLGVPGTGDDRTGATTHSSCWTITPSSCCCWTPYDRNLACWQLRIPCRTFDVSFATIYRKRCNMSKHKSTKYEQNHVLPCRLPRESLRR